jgi:hypothetical protein
MEKLTVLRSTKSAPLAAIETEKIVWLRQRFFQIDRRKVGLHFSAPA